MGSWWGHGPMIDKRGCRKNPRSSLGGRRFAALSHAPKLLADARRAAHSQSLRTPLPRHRGALPAQRRQEHPAALPQRRDDFARPKGFDLRVHECADEWPGARASSSRKPRLRRKIAQVKETFAPRLRPTTSTASGATSITTSAPTSSASTTRRRTRRRRVT